MVLLVPGVQACHVFLGYPAGGIDSRIAGQSGMACFVSSTVVELKMKDGMEKGNLIAYHLLESSTGAYIEWLVNVPMRLLIKIEYKDVCLVMLPAKCNKPTSQIALHILGVFSFLLSGKSC